MLNKNYKKELLIFKSSFFVCIKKLFCNLFVKNILKSFEIMYNTQKSKKKGIKE